MNHAAFPFDIKSLSDAGQIEGLAAGYGNLDAHGDIFAPGAFTKSIAAISRGGRTPAMLLHHDQRRPAGRWTDFAETPKGLVVKGHLAIEAADGREAYALLKGGALTGLSVGYREKAAKAGPQGANLITEADLFEVSLVATPSNPITTISSVKGIGDVRDLENLLREHGFSSRKAKAAASAAWRAVGDHQDEDDAVAGKLAGILSRASLTLSSITRS